MLRIGLWITLFTLLPRAVGARMEVSAQSPVTEERELRACFHPRPLPKCHSFWISEFGVISFVTSPPGSEVDPRGSLLTWEIGRLVNRPSGDALGGGLFLAANDNQFRFGPRLRYRRWFSSLASFEMAPGLIVLHSDEDLAVAPRLGLSAQASIGLYDVVGAVAQVEVAPGGTGMQLGARLGSFPGAIAGLGLPLLALIFMSE